MKSRTDVTCQEVQWIVINNLLKILVFTQKTSRDNELRNNKVSTVYAERKLLS